MSKKQIGIIAAIGAVIVAVSTAFSVYAFTYDKAFANVTVANLPVSGKTAEEIVALMSENEATEFEAVEFDIVIGEKTTHVTADQLKARRNWEAAAEEAMSVGRTGSYFKRFWKVFSCLFAKNDIKPSILPDETAVNELIAKLAEENDVAPVHASYNADTDKKILTLSPARDGLKLNREELSTQITNRFDTETYDDIVINPEVDPATPLDLDKIYQEVHTEVKDATMSVDGDNHLVSPHVVGVDFDLEAAKKQVSESPDKKVEISLKITNPKVTTKMVESTLFKDTLSSVTSYYNPQKVNRTHNVALAAKYVNGTILNPGEVFSYNKVVGPRTAARGFREAAIFSGGEVVDGLGGGICQVSSTLYRATMQADLKTVSRKNHSFYVDYAPKGEDATVVYGSIDFQFKNDTSYPIKIVAVQKKNYVTVTIMGTKTEEKKVKITTKTLSTTNFSEKVVQDNSLKPGERVIEQKGQQGMTMEVYRNVYDKNGKLLRSYLENKTRYVPMTQIVRVGPKATDAATTQPATTPSTTPAATDSATTTTPAETTPTIPEQQPAETTPSTPAEPEQPAQAEESPSENPSQETETTEETTDEAPEGTTEVSDSGETVTE